VVAPPPRALPKSGVTNEDIFVKAWFDKDEVYLNEPAVLTYTIYTRLSATYKGFEKEPVTTGFWVEDFPPEKTTKRTEQIINGSRYVVADVRKMALFPTQAGVFTMDPGVVSTMVETRDNDDFDDFFSYNIFGRRSRMIPTSFVSQVFAKPIPMEPIQLVVKALPETGKPLNFSGAVGDYQIESSIDKREIEVGNPVTFRVRVRGRGNVNVIQTPPLPKIEDFKVYDSSSSVNISKERLRVEGEKITETVLVPKKEGAYTIPELEFVFFSPAAESYQTLKTQAHVLTVKPSSEEETATAANLPVQPVEEKEEVNLVGKDIRFIKTVNTAPSDLRKPLYKNPLYWIFNLVLFLGLMILTFLSGRRDTARDLRGMRLRRSHRMARQKLRLASTQLRKGKHEEFYEELSRAVYGYFSDKLDCPPQSVGIETLEEKLGQEEHGPEIVNRARSLFDELYKGRFGKIEKTPEEMKTVYEEADDLITLAEKVRLK
jgi:hypothetical protein